MSSFDNPYGGSISAPMQGGRAAGMMQMGQYGGAGVMGGGGGDNGIIAGVQNQWQQAQQANAARFKRILALAQNFGKVGLQDNAVATKNLQSQAAQNLIGRGLGNSSVTQTVQSGIAQRGQRNANAIKESSTGLQMNALSQQQDQYPNIGAYAQMMSQPRFQGAVGGGRGGAAMYQQSNLPFG